VRKAFKYRLFPTAAQARRLRETLELCRWVYNETLATRKHAWEEQRVSLGWYDTKAMLPAWKDVKPELRRVHSQVLQDVTNRVNRAFEGFFARVEAGAEMAGFPRFKGYGRYDSFTFPQYGNGVELEHTGRRDAYLTASKIGRIYLKYHRPIQGTIKTVTVRRTPLNEWFVCFSVESAARRAPEPAVEEVGIDVGLTHFATLSDGSTIANPRFFRSDEESLGKVQRHVARELERAKQNGRRARNQRERTRRHTPYLNKRGKAVRKVHKRIGNRRENFVHQETRKLVDRFGALYVEDLNISGMLKNGRLAKSIADAAWGMFVQILAYKAAEAGRQFRMVPARGTSQRCSGCGETVPKDLTVRVHQCPHCSLILDRDHNAALNICALGRQCL
jgi:putative transposase